MAKHNKTHKQNHSTITVTVMGLVLAASFFSVERFTGTGDEAHGQSLYQSLIMPSGYSSAIPSSYTTRSKTKSYTSPAAAKRTGRRNVRLGASTEPRCSDAACTNLMDAFIDGTPTCLKSVTCTKQLNIAIASRYCSNNRTCVLLRSLKDFFDISPDCVQQNTPMCEYDIRRIILLTR